MKRFVLALLAVCALSLFETGNAEARSWRRGGTYYYPSYSSSYYYDGYTPYYRSYNRSYYSPSYYDGGGYYYSSPRFGGWSIGW